MAKATLIVPVLTDVPNPEYERLSTDQRLLPTTDVDMYVEVPVQTSHEVDARPWQISLSSKIGEQALALDRKPKLHLLAGGMARVCEMIAPAPELAVTAEAVRRVEQGQKYMRPESIDVVPQILAHNASLKSQINV